jgi:hypothetical protein
MDAVTHLARRWASWPPMIASGGARLLLSTASYLWPSASPAAEPALPTKRPTPARALSPVAARCPKWRRP